MKNYRSLLLALLVLASLTGGCSPAGKLPCPAAGDVIAFPDPDEGLCRFHRAE